MPLAEVEIGSAKAAEKPVEIVRWRRLKYRHHGKKRGISLGVYPEVSLKQARARRDEARRLVADGVDPSAERKAEKVRRERRSKRSRKSGWRCERRH